MRRFIIIGCLVAGGFAIAGPLDTDDPQSLLPLEDDFFGDQDVDLGHGLVAVDVSEDYVVPEDHGDQMVVLDFTRNSTVTHLDAAGVERSPSGKPIDAPPGSRDAANTGMQHDLGSGTVTNTTSVEPTPSMQALAADPGIAEQGAPTD